MLKERSMTTISRKPDDLQSLAEARKLVQELKDKISAQAKQLLAWRRAYKMQEVFISRLHHQKEDQLKALSSKLLLFESRLLRKQNDISAMLNHREKIIHRQQRVIELLTNRLIDNGLDPPVNELTELETNLHDLESLNDSDSAVVMEDVDSENYASHVPKFKGNSDCITIARSISDAIDPNLKYTSRRSNCYLRRPEILETVYSVEEDGDSADNQSANVTAASSTDGGTTSPATIQATTVNGSTALPLPSPPKSPGAATTPEANRRRDAFASSSGKAICAHEVEVTAQSSPSQATPKVKESPTRTARQQMAVPNRQSCMNGVAGANGNSYVACSSAGSSTQGPPNPQVTTYNRVMSNHRSVTKPKDVKYKRINKAKSKSLEELRGRLKNWVEQGTRFAGLSLEHSQSYA